jgi:predicted acylesterase/phospholipase RssA
MPDTLIEESPGLTAEPKLNNSNKDEFQIALTSAGAISAGAYTAGVMDFLLKALSDWYKAKANNENVPTHNVKIKALSGASAGGMCTALSAVSFCAGNTEKFKQSWVDKIDILELLDDKDLNKDKNAIVSLLNCNVLEEIAKDAIKWNTSMTNWYPFLDDAIPMFLTMTNLNGSPYGIEMRGQQDSSYIAHNHADFVEFCLHKKEMTPPGISEWVIPISPVSADKENVQNWEFLRDSALATGAFPLALRSRSIKMKSTRPRRRVMHFPALTDFPETIKVLALHDDERDYLFVDGGMTNNEPFGLVRKVLAGPDGRNPQNAYEANRAVIMIDPFPDSSRDVEYTPRKTDLMSLPGYLLNTLRQQSKFKSEDILQAMQEDVYSRFIIAPKRKVTDGAEQRKLSKNKLVPIQLASGLLGAFGGFLDKKFREHDFELGRRNCQQFLRKHFVLPEDHSLFNSWKGESQLVEHFLVKDDNGEPERAEVIDERGQKKSIRFLPIIPLVGNEVQNEVEQLEWPKISKGKLEAVEKKIHNRIKLLGERVLSMVEMNWFFGWAFRLAWNWKFSEQASDAINTKIRIELEKNSLID